MKFLLVRAVPTVSWSSTNPLNFKPAADTLCFLLCGLVIFGLGEALLIAAGVGVSPWTVLAQGLGVQTGISIGWATFVVSLAVLILWIPLRQTPGLGTLLNAVVISLIIEVSLPYLPQPEHVGLQLLEAAGGVLTVGLGSGIYLIAKLGPGPRDGLMTGIQRLTGFPIAWVRTCLELLAVVSGWLLGGSVGIGTVLFALGIGPAVSLGLYLVAGIFGSLSADSK
ncbi:MAG: hypothetical protein RL839_01595 [Gammaproteobacteria bacterium]